MSNSTDSSELKRLVRALQFSRSGLIAAYRNEAAFRTELLIAVVMIPVGIWLGDTGFEKAVLTASVLLILIVELLNSAIEAAVDRIGSEHHELAGRAKDMGSAAVFLTLVSAAAVWGFVLFG